MNHSGRNHNKIVPMAFLAVMLTTVITEPSFRAFTSFKRYKKPCITRPFIEESNAGVYRQGGRDVLDFASLFYVGSVK